MLVPCHPEYRSNIRYGPASKSDLRCFSSRAVLQWDHTVAQKIGAQRQQRDKLPDYSVEKTKATVSGVKICERDMDKKLVRGKHGKKEEIAPVA